VFVVTDASDTFNKTTRDAAWSRMEAAGSQLMSWFGTACELHRDWRNDIEGWARCSQIICRPIAASSPATWRVKLQRSKWACD
jgi:hypothetical protein